MRHFLIITCLAALAWATAPMQAALAQGDLPTVESEAGTPTDSTEEITPPKPKEVLPNVREPEEKDQHATERENGGEAGVSAALPLGDPLTILRLSVIPIFIWVIKNLISYSFLRRHVTRAIYVDIEYRMRFTELFIQSTKDWIEHYEPYKDRVPFLRVGREDHHMYANIQSDLRECTWGEEVAAVRLIYRSFDEVERAADRIRQTYSDLLALSREKSLAMKRDTEIELRQRMKDQIAAEIDRIEEVFGFWEKVGRKTKKVLPNKKDSKSDSWRFVWVVRGLLYRRQVWHSLCVYGPVVVLLFVGSMLLAPRVPTLFCILGIFVVGVALWEVYLFCCARRREEARIRQIVIAPFQLLLQKVLETKRPPIEI